MAEISIRDVRKTYAGQEVVHGVSLDIHNGEFVVILGPSGCGKSTLLRMIAGLEEITSGDIAIAGTVVNKLEPRERGCAMVFQNYALYPHMSVAETIGYALKVAGIKKAPRAESVARVAASVGLTDFLDRKPGQLSGGQRQRVAMARAIIREPKVFLFDEPLSNLDAKLRVQMRHEIRRIHNRIAATSVFVTHDQHEGMTLADRLVVMNKGTIEQVGTPAEIYDHPATIYVGGFIGNPAMNFLPGQIDAGRGEVILDSGARLSVAHADVAGQDGKLVQLGLRPEQILLTPDAAGDISARVDFVEELGSGRLYHLLLEDLPLTILSAQKYDLKEGAVVGITIPSRTIHLFSAATGRRFKTFPAAARQTVSRGRLFRAADCFARQSGHALTGRRKTSVPSRGGLRSATRQRCGSCGVTSTRPSPAHALRQGWQRRAGGRSGQGSAGPVPPGARR